MQVDINYFNKRVIINVTGRLDSSTTESFRLEMQKIDYSLIDCMTVDFKK